LLHHNKLQNFVHTGNSTIKETVSRREVYIWD